MKTVYLIRHGVAAERGPEYPDDSKRPLTEQGISRLKREAQALSELDITFDQRTLHVMLGKRSVLEQGQEPRFFLRAANFLHLNRGKRAWSYIADAYAALLLFLAFSGMFMIAGRKGLWGRGAVLVLLGAAVPIAYVTLSG